ncbi:MAG: RHS repeat protein, partial [Planctomycetes bacterium]|nr:RHS repeat protein [Planctomycetota bacterium]
MNDPDMGAWSYLYDLNGNLDSQTDAKAQTVSFEYDDLNRVTFKDNPTDPDITYIYDEPFSTNSKGKLTTLIDASGTTKYYYDELGRTIETIKTVDGTPYSTETTYDALGRTKSLTYPDGEIVNYSYDTGGNLSSIYDGTTTYATHSGYNALGQNSNITYGNGVTTDYTYDDVTGNYRLKSIATETSTGTGLLNLSY